MALSPLVYRLKRTTPFQVHIADILDSAMSPLPFVSSINGRREEGKLRIKGTPALKEQDLLRVSPALAYGVQKAYIAPRKIGYPLDTFSPSMA